MSLFNEKSENPEIENEIINEAETAAEVAAAEEAPKTEEAPKAEEKAISETASEETAEKPKKLKNTFRLKYGGFSSTMIAIVLVAVIVLNLLMSVLNDRGLLKFDATSSSKYTISEENEAFIKKIDKPVTLTVLSTKSEYTNLANFAYQYMGVSDENNYYDQTVKLLDRYAELNDKIELKYIDFYGTQAKTIAEKHPSIFYGDILVSVTDEKNESKDRLVTFADIYKYESMYSQYYTITENNVESAVSSAINILLYSEEKNLALISSHSQAAVFNQYYSNALKLNGFNITNIEETVISSIDKNLDTVVIAAPTSDLLPEEITALNTWLDNGGQKGKSLIFIPGGSVNNFPNLKEFLEEWGIKYSTGTLYQTNKEYYYGEPTTTFAFPEDNDTTKKIVENTEAFCVLANNVPMEKAFDGFEGRTPTVVMSTNDAVAVKPEGADENWAPAADAELKSYATIIVSEDLNLIDNKPYRSYVSAFSSFDAVYSQWAQYDQLLNLDTAVNTALFTSGTDTEATVTFVPKTITTESFADKVTAAKTVIIDLVFIVIIPLTIIIIGIVVFVKRRRK